MLLLCEVFSSDWLHAFSFENDYIPTLSDYMQGFALIYMFAKDSHQAVFFYPIRRIDVIPRKRVCDRRQAYVITFWGVTYIFLRKWLHSDFVGLHTRLRLDFMWQIQKTALGLSFLSNPKDWQKHRVSGYVIAVRRMLFGTESFLRIDYIHFLAKMTTFRLRRITYKASPWFYVTDSKASPKAVFFIQSEGLVWNPALAGM